MPEALLFDFGVRENPVFELDEHEGGGNGSPESARPGLLSPCEDPTADFATTEAMVAGLVAESVRKDARILKLQEALGTAREKAVAGAASWEEKISRLRCELEAAKAALRDAELRSSGEAAEAELRRNRLLMRVEEAERRIEEGLVEREGALAELKRLAEEAEEMEKLFSGKVEEVLRDLETAEELRREEAERTMLLELEEAFDAMANAAKRDREEEALRFQSELEEARRAIEAAEESRREAEEKERRACLELDEARRGIAVLEKRCREAAAREAELLLSEVEKAREEEIESVQSELRRLQVQNSQTKKPSALPISQPLLCLPFAAALFSHRDSHHGCHNRDQQHRHHHHLTPRRRDFRDLGFRVTRDAKVAEAGGGGDELGWG
jgi:hypothetical protein